MVSNRYSKKWNRGAGEDSKRTLRDYVLKERGEKPAPTLRGLCKAKDTQNTLCKMEGRMVVTNKHTGETIRIFWYQYVKYRSWFYKNFLSLFFSIVFREWYRYMNPIEAYHFSRNLWLTPAARDFILTDWSL